MGLKALVLLNVSTFKRPCSIVGGFKFLVCAQDAHDWKRSKRGIGRSQVDQLSVAMHGQLL
jgi:hypothetical protein